MRFINKVEKAKARGAQPLAEARQYIDISDSETLSEEQPEFVKKRKRGRPRKVANAVLEKKTIKAAKSKRPTIEKVTGIPVEEDEEDGQEIIQTRPDVGQSLYYLEKSSSEFLEYVKTNEDVKALVQTYGVEKITDIEEKVGSVAKLLRSRRAPRATAKPVDGTLQSFDQYFVLRDVGNTIMLVAPVEIFKASVAIRSKTLGFVRKASEYWPLMCSISGVKNIVSPHEKMLDSEFWTHEVFRFSTFVDMKFQPTPFEAHQGVPRGMHCSSHVERKLMLWYACRVLCKVLGAEAPTSIRKQVFSLGQINNIRPRPMAEIVLDRNPCRNCKVFQAFMEDFTGIKFTFIVCSKLGKVKLEKDQRGNQVFPLLAEESVSSDDSEAEGGRSQVQVVVPQRFMAPTRVNKPGKLPITSNIRIDTKISVSQIATTKKSRQLTPDYAYEEEDNDDDIYTPTSRTSRYETPITPESRITRSSPLTPQGSFDFGYENLPRPRKENKKRKFDAAYYTSPISAKKYMKR
ncbi:uncharacterized protein BP5553_03861 [Venustampulla echinocandica]|uniref:Uncharacterized protein n=1 Tax=Venustampulla echinocandica TaxID=2656787 RepID=A0A370TVG9_9HELO|nr:uncharacterized protein BP5553_03861 [Venustampulla echinocandica]RDL39521.1 hypothetical protein BP5553_03861 [Venustampulla echinocandica]